MHKNLHSIFRERAENAIKQAGTEEVHILEDDELLKLHEATNFKSVYEHQRFNILIFGFRTGICVNVFFWVLGLRADSIEHLKFGMFKEGVTEDGQQFWQAHIGSAKNIQCDLDHVDTAIFKQKNFAHADERCACKHMLRIV